MNTIILLLITVAALAAVAFAAAQIARLIFSDGYGHRPIPRSHHDEAAVSDWR